HADGIVWAGCDPDPVVRLDTPEVELRIVIVDGVLDHAVHAEGAARRRLLLAADRGGIEGHELAVAVERAHGSHGFVDFDARDRARRPALADIRHADGRARAIKSLSGVEAAEQP